MTVSARFKFDQAAVEKMPLTISFTASLSDWRELLATFETQPHEPEKEVGHCIKNIIEAVNRATGQSYHTQGYSFEAAKPFKEAE